MRDLAYVAGRAIETGVLCAMVWGAPMFVIDTVRAFTNLSQGTQQQNAPKSMIRAPFDTPYTDNAIKYAGSLGLLVGLVVGIHDVRKRKKRYTDRESGNPYRWDDSQISVVKTS